MEPKAKRARNTEGGASPTYAPTSPVQSDDDDGIIWMNPDEVMGPDHVPAAEVLRQRAEQDAAAMAVESAEQDAAAAMAVDAAAMAVENAEQDAASEPARIVFGQGGYQISAERIAQASFPRTTA